MTAVIFDTEMTDKKDGEIIEAAWIYLGADNDLAGTPNIIPSPWFGFTPYVERFRPSKPISFGAMAVHNILPSELESCRPSSQFELPECQYLIGHSIDFDWAAAGSPAHVKRICTHAMSQWIWPDATGYSQSALIYMLEGATPETRAMLNGAHGAVCDVQNNLLLLNHILAQKPEIVTWSQLWEFSEECRIPRTCPMKRYEGVLLQNLDDGFINWCLNQYWLDPYFRKGLERVLSGRYAHQDEAEKEGIYEPCF